LMILRRRYSQLQLRVQFTPFDRRNSAIALQ
jgi:hypothetical protein